MTVADIAPHADKKGKFWSDGTFARFAFITPPKDARSKARFPVGKCEIPQSLVEPLKAWHQRLGMPLVIVSEKKNSKGETTGHGAERTELPKVELSLGDGVEDAYYSYDDALSDIVDENPAFSHFASWYARLARKALRIAALFASLSNSSEITLAHFARAQQITEAWRENLHGLYAQVKAGDIDTGQADEEDEFVALVGKLCKQKGDGVTPTDIKRNTRKWDTPTITAMARRLAASHVLEEHVTPLPLRVTT
jgi:hypothetical protein